ASTGPGATHASATRRLERLAVLQLGQVVELAARVGVGGRDAHERDLLTPDILVEPEEAFHLDPHRGRNGLGLERVPRRAPVAGAVERIAPVVEFEARLAEAVQD